MTPTEPRPVGRLGPWFASLWLFFLLDPIVAGGQEPNHLRGGLGILATLVFATTYMWLWFQARRDRNEHLITTPPLVYGATSMAVLLVLGVAMILLVGEPGLAASVYLAVAAILVLPSRFAVVFVLADAVVTVLLGGLPGWDSQVGTAFGVLAASAAIFGLRRLLSQNLELVSAQRRNSALAVENERSRFARDLHDILGHSLTVITVKAELAHRLLESDAPAARERARSEVADLERLSRDALADVRRAVGGYRELSLSGELVRARDALTTAEISAELPGSTDEVPGALQELFAWAVREGVTNVIRHSGASRCRVDIAASSCCVEDDGVGAGQGAGHGLSGLRERCAAAGAVLVTGPGSPRGFRLEVRVP